MKLPSLVTGGVHALEGAPLGVEFDARTREVAVDALPPGSRYSCRLVGRAGGVEVTMPLTIANAGEPPKRRRRTAVRKS